MNTRAPQCSHAVTVPSALDSHAVVARGEIRVLQQHLFDRHTQHSEPAPAPGHKTQHQHSHPHPRPHPRCYGHAARPLNTVAYECIARLRQCIPAPWPQAPHTGNHTLGPRAASGCWCCFFAWALVRVRVLARCEWLMVLVLGAGAGAGAASHIGGGVRVKAVRVGGMVVVEHCEPPRHLDSMPSRVMEKPRQAPRLDLHTRPHTRVRARASGRIPEHTAYIGSRV